MAFDLTKEELLKEYNEYVYDTYKAKPSSLAEKKMATTVGNALISVCLQEEGEDSRYYYWKNRVEPVWGGAFIKSITANCPKNLINGLTLQRRT